MGLQAVPPEEFCHCPVSVFGKEKLLLTAENQRGEANPMTVGWGGIGYFWGVPTVFYGIRPERHTFSFAEEGEAVSLSVLPSAYAAALTYCGTHSGREGDKWRGAGLTPMKTPDGITAASEARLIITARKCYATRIEEAGFFEKEPLAWYRRGGFHTLYLARILHVYRKE